MSTFLQLAHPVLEPPGFFDALGGDQKQPSSFGIHDFAIFHTHLQYLQEGST